MRKITRISITLPENLVLGADRRARQLDRSRSWVLADALRRLLSDRPVAAVREPARHPNAVSPGLGEYRLQQLEADLALTPEQRVREAERTAREVELARGATPGRGVRFFDHYEDYLAWKRREAL